MRCVVAGAVTRTHLSRFTLLLLSGLTAWGYNPNPSPWIYINNNAGFEVPNIPAGTSTTSIVGWTGTNNCSTGQSGVTRPLAANAPANDSSQLGYFKLCEGGAASFIQLLPQTFAAGATYTFSLDVFNPDPTAAISLIMWVGTGSHEQDVKSNCSPNCTLSVTYATDAIALGQQIRLEIRAQQSTGIVGKIQFIYVDNARLEVNYPLQITTHGIHGMFGPLPGQTVHPNAVCSALSPSDCTLSLDLLDSHGVLLGQKQTTLRPGMSTALDYIIPDNDRSQTNQELVPIWYLATGQASFSFEILNSRFGGTSLFTNWADGSVSQLGNLASGPVSLTRRENARVRVWCDGSVPNADNQVPACNADVRFADTATGRILKESRMTLRPNTGGYVDLLFEDTAPLGTRVWITPMVTITGGPGVASVALLDRFEGGTLVQSSLSLPVTAR